MRIVGFSFSVYISKKIGAEALGIFSLIMSVYMFMITIATSGINLATTMVVVEETAHIQNTNTNKAMKKCLLYSVSFGLLACVLLFLFANVITSNFLHNQIPNYLLYIIAISLPFIAMASCLNGYFTALRKNGKNAVNRIFEQFIKILFTAFFLSLFLPNGLEYACLSLVLGEMISEVASCLFAFFLYFMERKKHTYINTTKTNYFKKITSISIPVAITSYIRSGLSSLKQLLIPIRLERSGLTCNEAVSSYGLIQGMTLPILLFPEVIIHSFSSLVVPEFAYYNVKKENSKITYAISRILRITFLFSIGMIGVFYFYAKPISYLIYQNFDIANYLKILSPLLFLMYLDSIVDNVLKGLDQQIGVMKCNILDLIVSIICIYFLLPIFGINGYLLVICISELLNTGISLWQLKKITKFKIDFKNWIIKPVIGIIISYAICHFLAPIIVLSTSSIILNLILFLGFYFSFLLLSKSFHS